ncbi:MAG: VOC family protein [Hyphomicrobiaceae bacterium]
MVNARSGVPRGYQAVMPYLRVRDAASAIRFYKTVFGASERYRLKMAGKIGHAELELGGSTVMLSDEFPEVNAIGPKALKGTSVSLTVYVENVDRVVAKAVKAGAKIRRAAADQFYGDRSAQIEDPFGHVWSIQSRIEKVNPKDMQKRLNALVKAEAAAAIARRAPRRSTAAKGGRGSKGTAAKPRAAPAKKRDAPSKGATTRKAPVRKPAAVEGSAAAKKAPMAKAASRNVGGRKAAGSRAVRGKAASRKVGRPGRPKKAAKT